MADYCHILDVLCQHSQGAFLPVKERDLFLFDPQPTVHEELNPTCHSLVFQDPSLEEPDLGATMGTEVPRTTRVLFAARVSYTRIQTLNSRSFYSSIWSGQLTGRSHWEVWQGADCLDVCQQSTQSESEPGHQNSLPLRQQHNAARQKRSKEKERRYFFSCNTSSYLDTFVNLYSSACSAATSLQ